MLASQASTASKRRKDKKDNTLADDEDELMVASYPEENLEPIGKDAEGIFYDPPGSG